MTGIRNGRWGSRSELLQVVVGTCFTYLVRRMAVIQGNNICFCRELSITTPAGWVSVGSPDIDKRSFALPRVFGMDSFFRRCFG